MELRVHEVNQTSSGGSHVTIYEVDMEIVANVGVQVIGSEPKDAPRGYYHHAAKAICKGAEV
jgi:hypothetical protein